MILYFNIYMAGIILIFLLLRLSFSVLFNPGIIGDKTIEDKLFLLSIKIIDVKVWTQPVIKVFKPTNKRAIYTYNFGG